jgi:putative hemolysin
MYHGTVIATVVPMNPFALDPEALGVRIPNLLWRVLRPRLERMLGLEALRRCYTRAVACPEPADFSERALKAVGVSWVVPEDDLARVPTAGPLVAVANHPFGLLDGLILIALLQRIRPDVRVFGNFLLWRIPELRETIIPVDPFGGAAATSRNVGPLRSAIEWLKGGGVLGVFPAGEVAHWSPRDCCVRDPAWSPMVARMVAGARCDVLPVFFQGQNGPSFQLFGLLHPRLRTIMLPREALNKRRHVVHGRIGTVIPFSRSNRFEDSQELIDYLRVRTMILGGKTNGSEPEPRTSESAALQPFEIAIAAPGDRSRIVEEVERLRKDHRLLASGDYEVFCAPKEVMPGILHEIGRLREKTFRAVGEGTGRSLDLDRFDDYYLHLFVWNRRGEELVGAYRLGLVDRIIARFGVRGLYTSTLFRFGRRLLEQMGPAIELGRSFVVAEYQRSYPALFWLWKGIGRFVCENPPYRALFGAVSISAEYGPMTKQLLMAFLRQNHFDADLAALAKPRNPPRWRRFPEGCPELLSSVVRKIEDVDELVEEIEARHQGVPILVRQYLKLRARLLGFNIDPDFGNVLDGLFYVDLTQVDRSILDRYMGREEAGVFLRRCGEVSQ